MDVQLHKQGLTKRRCEAKHGQQNLKAGRLQQILPEYEMPSATAYAVYLPNRYLPPKTRAFIDFFVERFQPNPYWDTWRKSGI